ncbi:hypothetical protein Clacol_002672 [Clathrus columnatus]|uniref:N-acetyl-D-glucosamine kinase n=1 Tax=Clathrus columnatus TaxID=1419009 RepID=A0AAV5A6T9_9AGAM|nr:hypothetical protein Clacol_002672 [Clathrus columnatus]
MSSITYYLCADCGGTKTSVVICDSNGKEINRALGGPSNLSYLGVNAFVKVLQETVQKALYPKLEQDLITDLSFEGKFAAVWIGVSGVDSPSDIQSLNEALSPLFAIPPGNRLQITNDAHLLASPLNSHPELKHAVSVIAGTGSVVISFSKGDSLENGGPTPLKEMARVGGWGWILGDLGSGFEIGKEAIREILFRADNLSVEGQPIVPTAADPKSLQSRILSHFGISLVPDLFGVIYAPDPLPTNTNIVNGSEKKKHPTMYIPRERRLSQLCPLIFEAAFEHGDELALTVLRRCANAFAHLIASILQPTSGRIPKRAVEASKSIFCLGGSLLGIVQYQDLICEELEKLGHVFPVIQFVNDVALSGAQSLAALDR